MGGGSWRGREGFGWMRDTRAELEAAIDEAFARYGTSALWSKRRSPRIGPGAGFAVSRTLLREDPLAARRLALRMRNLSDALERSQTLLLVQDPPAAETAGEGQGEGS